MDRDTLTIVFIVGLVLLLAFGIPIGASVILIAGFVIYMAANVDFSLAVATAMYSQFSSWGISALPLFILMGEVLSRTGVAAKIFNAMAVLISRMPGGLLQVNIIASALFSALSGSSTATVATIGKLSLPELEKRHYSMRLSLGSLAGGGTLGILIPPSVALVLYGFTFDVSISDLFLAGVVPGIIMTIVFAAYIALRHDGGASVPNTTEDDTPKMSSGAAILDLLPLLGLIAVVFGSIYGGFATPTEAAVIGVVGGIVLAAADRRLSLSSLYESLFATVVFVGALGFVLGASAGLQVAMAYTGIPREIVSWVKEAGLGQYQLLFVLGLVLIVLGCFIDGLSMIVLTGAILLPLVKASGIDLLWFGIFMVVLVEIGLVTPPIGFNLFVLQKLSARNILFIAMGAVPFMLLMIGVLVLLTVFPALVTWLPNAV